MRKIVGWTVLAVVLALGVGGFAFAAAQPDKVVISEIQKIKGPTPFDHKKHTELAKNCQICHHADSPAKEQKCSSCHKDKTEGKKLSLKDAFHSQCKDCHTKQGKGPTKCDGCHTKK